jgi:hypothetical protein
VDGFYEVIKAYIYLNRSSGSMDMNNISSSNYNNNNNNGNRNGNRSMTKDPHIPNAKAYQKAFYSPFRAKIGNVFGSNATDNLLTSIVAERKEQGLDIGARGGGNGYDGLNGKWNDDCKEDFGEDHVGDVKGKSNDEMDDGNDVNNAILSSL